MQVANSDGIYVKAGLDKRKVVLAAESGYWESTESWAALLRDLKTRGLRAPRLLIADGRLGIWAAVLEVFPTASEQRCWNHRLVNVLDTLPKTLQAEARALTKIPYAATRAEAERQKRSFRAWPRRSGSRRRAAGWTRTGSGW